MSGPKWTPGPWYVYHPLMDITRERDSLREAIAWALGERDEFPLREQGQGAFWWRAELRRRAALAGSGKEAQFQDAEPMRWSAGGLCGLCDSSHEHEHPQKRCARCGAIGLAENMAAGRHGCRAGSGKP